MRDAAMADARHRGLVITRRTPCPRCHRGTPGAGREPASAPPAHFNEGQAEQVLWQEFRDHGASLNNALNEAVRIHAGPAWQIFKVCVLIDSRFSLVAFASARSLT
jgi:hypothetical protein